MSGRQAGLVVERTLPVTGSPQQLGAVVGLSAAEHAVCFAVLGESGWVVGRRMWRWVSQVWREGSADILCKLGVRTPSQHTSNTVDVGAGMLPCNCWSLLCQVQRVARIGSLDSVPCVAALAASCNVAKLTKGIHPSSGQDLLASSRTVSGKVCHAFWQSLRWHSLLP